MEVILLADVEQVGLRGEVVNVARGLRAQLPAAAAARRAGDAGPRRRAAAASTSSARGTRPARVEQAQEIADMLDKTVLRFDVKSGPTGALFGSVTPTDIADELWRTRKIRVDRQEDRHRLDQAHRPLHGPDPGLRGRERRGEDARRARGRRAAARGGAGGDGGGRGRARGRGGGRGRGARPSAPRTETVECLEDEPEAEGERSRRRGAEAPSRLPEAEAADARRRRPSRAAEPEPQ